MSRRPPRYTEHNVTADTALLLELAVVMLEEGHQGHLVALVFIDKESTFFHFLPGHEAAVARELAAVEWPELVRSVEEHAP